MGVFDFGSALILLFQAEACDRNITGRQARRGLGKLVQKLESSLKETAVTLQQNYSQGSSYLQVSKYHMAQGKCPVMVTPRICALEHPTLISGFHCSPDMLNSSC